MTFFEKYRLELSILIFVLFCSATTFLWLNYNASVNQSLRGKVTDTSKLVTQQFYEALSQNVNRLDNLKKRIEYTDGAYFEYWSNDAALLVDQESSFLFVEWIDSSMVIQMVEPMQGNEQAIGLDISNLDYRNADWTKARLDSVFNLTQWIALTQGDSAFLVDAPTYIDGEFQGTITAGMDFTSRFNTIMQGLEQYHLELLDEQGMKFYSFGSPKGTQQFSDIAVQDSIVLDDANAGVWKTKMVPNYLFAEANAINDNFLNFILSLILCVLLSVSFYYIQGSRVAEKSSVRANERLRALIDSAPIAIYVIDSKGKVLDFWNSAAEKMLGWKKEEVIGNLLPMATENYADQVQQNIDASIDQGGIYNKEVTRKRKDGSKGEFRLHLGSITGKEQQILVLLEDITKEKEFELKLKNSLQEKDILLKEVHHRVKNNLAIIVGLIELHDDQVEDEKTRFLLSETKNRIFSISEVHELLYRSTNFSEISLSEYVSKLINRMRKTYQDGDRRVTFNTNANDFNVNINQAIPTGLILNELITNSYKHAFTDDKIDHPAIDIFLDESDENVRVHYADNGIGLEASKFENSNSMGVTIIKALLSQLSADYTLLNDKGFGIEFTFQSKEKGSHSNL